MTQRISTGISPSGAFSRDKVGEELIGKAKRGEYEIALDDAPSSREEKVDLESPFHGGAFRGSLLRKFDLSSEQKITTKRELKEKMTAEGFRGVEDLQNYVNNVEGEFGSYSQEKANLVYCDLQNMKKNCERAKLPEEVAPLMERLDACIEKLGASCKNSLQEILASQ